MTHGFQWYQLFPGYRPGYDHLIGSLLVALILTILSLLAWRVFRKEEVVPSSRFSVTTPFELIGELLLGLMKNIIGEHCERYLPLVGSVFVFILGCNLLGVIPGFLPPTDNLSTIIPMAVIVFLATHYYGIRHSGAHYGKQFLAPLAGIGGIFMSLLFTPIEMVSHLFRPMSLTLRLWGNVFADHTVLGIMEGLVPVVIPIPFMALGLFVSVLQAFIFALLTIIYIALATSDHH